MSDYESWLVKREEKAERKNAVFWLIFSIIIIGIAMWCFVDTIREYQFSENSCGKERVLRQSTMKDIMHISILKQEKAGLLFVRKVSSTKTRVIP